MTYLQVTKLTKFTINGLRPHVRKIVLATPLIILVMLLAFQAVRFASSNPLCCADDAAIADVAKSVASGDGYALPIKFDGASGRFLFNPSISTGPTLVLPTAVAIAAFGADPIIPGLTKAIISIALLCWILIGVTRRFKYSDGISYGVLLVVLLFLSTSGANFVQWYALIGELVAALLIILAVLFTTTSESEMRSVALGGFCLSLAILTKLLALLVLFPILLFVIYDSNVRSMLSLRWRRLGYFMLGLCLPLLLFVLWQSLSLGTHGSRIWLNTFLGSVHQHVQVGNPNNAKLDSILSRVSNNLHASINSYGHSALDTIIGLALFAMLVWTNATSKFVKRFVCCLALIAIVNLGWWMLFVIGAQWPRYELIGVILAAATMAGTQLVRLPTLGRLIGVILALCMLFPITNPTQIVWGGVAGPTAEGRERILALRSTIEPLQHYKHSVLIGGWWASLVTPKYLLSDNVSVVAFNKLSTVKGSYQKFLILDHKWDAFAKLDQDPAFLQFRSQCMDVISKNRYFTLFACQNE